jgi:hypothetical protein
MGTSKLSPNVDNLFLGKGALYFDRFDAYGNKTGELDLGNATAFSMQLAQTTKDHYTSREGIRKRDLVIAVEEKWSGKFTLEEYTKENLNLAMRGKLDPQYFTQGAGTATVPVTAHRSRWQDLGYRNLSTVTVAGMVENYDFKVDRKVGRIMFTYDGGAYEGQVISVSVIYAAVNQPIISPVVPSRDVSGFLRFVPNNDVQGPNYMAEIWDATIKCDSEIPFITEDWGKLSFTVEIDEDDASGSHKTTDPYFRLTELKTSTIIS